MDALLQTIVDRGTLPQRKKTRLAQFVRAPDGREIDLMGSDGKPTPAGKVYYQKLGVDPPMLYDYHQGLLNDTHVRGYDGKTIPVRQRNDDGTWRILPAGMGYFKYNRVEYLAQVP